MPYRMTRLGPRPRRNERNAMTFSSQRLPRSRCLTHSAGLVWSARFAASGFMERAVCPLAVFGPNRESNQSCRGRIVLDDEVLARANRVDKFCGAYAPGLQIDSACEFDGIEHLIEQYGTGQHRKCRKVARKRRVVRGDVERTLHLHGGSALRI